MNTLATYLINTLFVIIWLIQLILGITFVMIEF